MRKQIRTQHDNLICCCQGICHHRFNLFQKYFNGMQFSKQHLCAFLSIINSDNGIAHFSLQFPFQYAYEHKFIDNSFSYVVRVV